ncbi:hypothetical protein GALMADRAFT_80958 [Galerina marginata CBS 339.88]|uniref:alpha-1,2-Mannosidase n=1 Tax=Galerina marginata (strain CBS 339.88) TaxID=685588 RepID=A0A067SF84_GALM3|nr:hypothetical protein GALMADRAFT_80958 [Galerina marginata CBS 339.88]
MLPTHRHPQPTSTLTCVTHRFNVFRTAVFRWVILASIILGFLWLSGPPVGRILWPSPSGPSSPDTTAHHVRPIQPPPSPKPEEQKLWEPRKDEVREAFKHAWNGYRTRAFPADELLAVSGGNSNRFNGWSLTLFDSLDTMWVMGLQDEFADSIRSPNHYAPFFETTIRYLGGLLSAYALSGESILLTLADELGQVLIPAFRGTESGLPAFSVNVETGQIKSPYNTVFFAEATSCQLEFKYLAKLTGNPEYYQLAQNAMDLFYKANVTNGLFTEHWSMKEGVPVGSRFTVGAAADSGYEYLLKQWLLSGDERAREQYLKSAAGIIDNLIYITPKRGLMYVGDITHGAIVHHLEHLSCFLPGLFALGVHTLNLPADVRELHQWVAHGLTYTCAIAYADQQTGLGPEVLVMTQGKKWIDVVRQDYTNGWPNSYMLRPETVESIFYMWRITGDVKWRERGYSIFQAIIKQARTEYGFASVVGVDGASSQIDDMPSYFLAETLKYLYLLFDDTHSMPLDRWVFNTEAHPLPIFSWTELERVAFNISVS